MTITLITQEIYDELAALARDYPKLILQNRGYEYLPVAVVQEHTQQLARIREILKAHVLGFSKFFNFRIDDGRLVLRFDFDWGAEGSCVRFVGVGYLPLDHLLNGFPPHLLDEFPSKGELEPPQP